MSRIGKIPVAIPEKVKVIVSGSTVKIEGPKGKLEWTFDASMKVVVDEAKKQVRAAIGNRARRRIGFRVQGSGFRLRGR